MLEGAVRGCEAVVQELVVCPASTDILYSRNGLCLMVFFVMFMFVVKLPHVHVVLHGVAKVHRA